MPELPEVETVARLLRPELERRRIVGTRVRWARTLGGLSGAAFARGVSGARIVRVWRRGKFVVLDLERRGAAAGAIVGHLRMTGRLAVEAPATDAGPHARVALALDDGRELRFSDVRKFGRLTFTERPAELLAGLGPEPLGPEFTAAWLRAALGRRRRRLKPLLLDQSFVAGLGNIYVDETLHAAGLHPLRLAHTVPGPAADRLRAAIQRTLRAAIAREGSSFDVFYRTPEGNPGRYQEEFQVYGRDGEPCRSCGSEVRRIVVGQRGTHFCPRCQPAPRGAKHR